MQRLILFLVTAAVALGQGTATIADRYVSVKSARLNSDERIALYEKQSKAEPNNAAVQAALASSFIQKLRETTDFVYLDRATAVVNKMLAADPHSYDALRLSAVIATHRHDFPLAAKYAADLTDRNPSDSGTFGMLGDSLMELGQYDAANEAYTRMLTLSPNLAGYNRIAYHRWVTGNAKEALGWMATAVEAGSTIPENLAWCLVELGDMLFKTGKIEDAETAYHRALDTLPGYHRAHAALGRALAANGELEVAADHFRQAQSVIPLPEYAAALETLYTKLGKKSEADHQRSLLDVIDKLGRVNGEKGNRALAIAYADEGRNLDRAVELARADLAVRNDVYTYDAVGWTLFKSGKQKEAEEASKHALALNTPEPMFLYHAGVIAMAGGNLEQGKSLLQRAEALNPIFAFPQAGDAKRLVSER